MSNISSWSATAASNNSAPPNGAPEGMAPSTVNDVMRENMAAVSKWYSALQGALVTTGSGNAYVLSTGSSHASLAVIGLVVFRANHTNSGASTIAVDGLTAKNLYFSGVALASGQITSGQTYAAAYNSANDVFDLISIGGQATLNGTETLSNKTINTARATVASHATTADIWTGGNQIDWTGIETTTAFPAAPQAGAQRRLICAGACSFTAGANMLIAGVTSGNTVTCAANDIVVVDAVSTTQFKLTRIKYDGTPQVSAAGGSLVHLSTVTASASATVDIETTFDATYDAYVIVATGVKSASNGVNLQARVKSDGAYVSSGVYQYHTHYGENNDATYKALIGALQTQIEVLRSIDNDADDNCNFQMMVFSPSSTTLQKCLQWHGTSTNVSGTFNSGSGWVASAAAVTGVRFFCSTGNIASGEFRLYGIKKS